MHRFRRVLGSFCLMAALASGCGGTAPPSSPATDVPSAPSPMAVSSDTTPIPLTPGSGARWLNVAAAVPLKIEPVLLSEPELTVSDLSLSSDGKGLTVQVLAGGSYVLDLDRKERTREFAFDTLPFGTSVTPNRLYYVRGGPDETRQVVLGGLWDKEGAEDKIVLEGLKSVSLVRVSPGEELVAVVDNQGKLKVFREADKTLAFETPLLPEGRLFVAYAIDAAFSADGKQLAVSQMERATGPSKPSILTVYSTADGSKVSTHTTPPEEEVRSVELAAASPRMFKRAYQSFHVADWSGREQRKVEIASQSSPENAGWLDNVSVSRNGRWAVIIPASSALEKVDEIWFYVVDLERQGQDIQARIPVTSPLSPLLSERTLVISDDGKRIVAMRNDNRLGLWVIP